MTLPREILPGRFYMVTRRCTQRLFLLRPDYREARAGWIDRDAITFLAGTYWLRRFARIPVTS